MSVSFAGRWGALLGFVGLGLASAAMTAEEAPSLVVESAEFGPAEFGPAEFDPGQLEPGDGEPAWVESFGGPRQSGFSHRSHVRKNWLRAAVREVARDCRGCHQFSVESGREVQANVSDRCVDCHVGGWYRIDPARVADGSLSALQDYPTNFFHTDHIRGLGQTEGMDCKVCHTGDSLSEGHFRIPRGVQFCAGCHDPSQWAGREEVAAFVADSSKAAAFDQAFRRHLDQSPVMQPSAESDPGQGGPFFHVEHQSRRCDTCHSSLGGGAEAATPAFITTKFETDSCGDCHRGPSAALIFSMREQPRPVLSAGTFYHADHFGLGSPTPGASSALAFQELSAAEGESCAICHVASKAGERQSAAFQFAHRGGDAGGSVASYEGCADCHQDWTLGRPHEDWEARKCTQCHEFGGVDMKSERRRVEVMRAADIEFSFSNHAHPFISKDGSGAPAAEQCAQCHRAQVDTLPSRIDGSWARFDHDVHLAVDAGAEACEECHGGAGVDDSVSSAMLGELAEGGFRRSYRLEACAECHRGGLASEARAIQEREVTEFPHAAHVGREFQGVSMDCATCHSVQQGPAVDSFTKVGTLPDALDCSRCHDHDENAAWTPVQPELAAEALHDCGKCHFDRPLDRPPAPNGPRVRAPLLADSEPISPPHRVLGQADAATVHPLGWECARCHGPARQAFERERDFLLVQRSGARQGQSFHEQAGQTNSALGNCLGCHWADIPEGRGTKYEWRLPASQSPLKLLGEEMERFPGRGARGDAQGR